MRIAGQQVDIYCVCMLYVHNTFVILHLLFALYIIFKDFGIVSIAGIAMHDFLFLTIIAVISSLSL
jgi:hypothetical protein